jgi:hypothetical protein
MWQAFDQVNEFSRAAVAACFRFNQITARNVERFAKAQLDYAESTFKQVKTLGDVRDPQKFWSAPLELASETNARWMEHARKTAEIVNDAGNELTGFMTDGWNTFTAAATPKPGPRRAA